MKLYYICLLFQFWVFSVDSLTEIVSTTDCFSIPNNPLSVIGVRIMSGRERAKKVCYYAPKTNEYYFSILINNLNLSPSLNFCPTFKLEVYQVVRYESEMINEILIQWEVPENPKSIFEADCHNYKSKIKTIVQTITPGDRVILSYDPGDNVAPEGAFFITLSSYAVGQSYSCPDSKFRCWNTNYKCIDESLVCDNVDNCYDDSDENDYKCTGRIANIPMPLFVIIIISAILLLIFIIMIIILIMRNRKTSKMQKRKLLSDMHDRAYEDDTLPPRSYMS